ncbi:uncharacterized protein N7515_004041 [Penicillium bovifimosum]|uniref:Trichothecene 3-O-acetyltransferase n=1 Tax=Penicillium bovifimosum TaxID=126998 RepID=A0A9W9H694_9EURO|nr:uncharacterized protein N7515_004041 [Penicillium bovifimosum]KAJ5139193.1 hypothetical protein N7515_004041 [Penicillium bovifimosum]
MSAIAETEVSFPPSSVAVIKPHPHSHGQRVRLSAIDQIAPRDYMSICLFFPLGPDADKRRIFTLLQESLLRIVDDMPELACCVQKHTGNGREEVELVFDSSKGVEIHYKDYTSPELCDLWKFGTFYQLEQEHFPLNKLPRHIVFGTSAKLADNVKLPSLVVQTSFIPGGMILGSCLHHVAGDGQCNFMLFSAIGAHFSAVADGLDSKPISQIHLRERSGVVEGDKNVKLEEFPHWKLAEENTEFLNPTAYSANDPTFEYATYFISGENLALLRTRISNNCSGTKLSTVESLGAFIWRHIIVARNIDPRVYPEAKLSIAIDARGRTKNPYIPSNYWGNFAEPNAVARLPVARLQEGISSSLTPKQLGNKLYPEAALRIQRAIAAVDDKAVRRLVGLLNQMPKSTTLTWNVNRYPGPDMLLVCVNGHRYNDIYFGHQLGYTSAFRCTVGDTEGKPDGRCLILPPRRGDGKGLEIMLQYDKSTLKRLEDNVEFGDYFVRRN